MTQLATAQEAGCTCDAYSVGYGVTELFGGGTSSGRVHSRFRTAINVEIAGRGLVTITNRPERHCLAINVAAALPRWPVGSRLLITNDTLGVPGGDHVSFSGSSRWRAAALHPGTSEAVVRAETVARFVAQREKLGGLGQLLTLLTGDRERTVTPLSKRALPGLALLLKGLGRTEAELVRQGTRVLAGLGPGLTPSGDDILAGVMGAWWWRHSGEWTDHELNCRQAVLAEGASLTNVFGYQEISCAAEGELPESAVTFILSLLGERLDWQGSAVSLTRLGSTSGLDMLAGICFAMSFLDDDDLNWGE